MQTATKQLWAGVLAAVLGSLCCVAPLVLLLGGISGAWISQLTALEPYRPIFIGVSKATAARLTKATAEAGFPSTLLTKR